jgi:hypothetical protein
VIPEGERLPDFAVYIPAMSLPRIFGTTLATVPARVRGGCSVRKYLRAKPSRSGCGRRSPKDWLFLGNFISQGVFFFDFSTIAPTLRGFIA